MYKKFEELLLSNNVNAFRVAQDTGIPPSTFSDWKSGRSKPKADKIQLLAAYFNVPLEYFYADDEERRR